MHVIAKRALEDFWRVHPVAQSAFEAWYKLIHQGSFSTFTELLQTFGSADYVAPYTIFNAGGNHFRIITAIHYNRQKVYIRHVFTHAEYDRWCRQQRSKPS